MTLTQVLYALEVARCQNFSKAAENLYLSQPALSLQIKKLENELGYALFSRTPQGIFLTEAGRNFCAHAAPVSESWKLFQENVVTQKPSFRRLRVGMGSRVYSNGLFQDVVRFFDSHPNLEVTFVTEAGQDFLTGLRDGALDLALDRMPPDNLMRDRKLYYRTSLICERQCVLMSADDPHSRLSSLSFPDLQGCTMMSGLENSMEDRTLREVCRKHNITLRRIYHSDGIDTNMRLVRDGSGVILGPESFASYFGVAAVPLIPRQTVCLDFICLRQNADRPEIRLLCRHLQEICRQRMAARQEALHGSMGSLQ
jgi:DNA-binding transcriptional LysR family regulator